MEASEDVLAGCAALARSDAKSWAHSRQGPPSAVNRCCAVCGQSATRLAPSCVLSKRNPRTSRQSRLVAAELWNPTRTEDTRAADADSEAFGRHIVTLHDRSAFLQGKISGATSSKGPSAKARAVFGGVAPARAAVRRRCAGRPDRIHKCLIVKDLLGPQVFRGGRETGSSRARRVFR